MLCLFSKKLIYSHLIDIVKTSVPYSILLLNHLFDFRRFWNESDHLDAESLIDFQNATRVFVEVTVHGSREDSDQLLPADDPISVKTHLMSSDDELDAETSAHVIDHIGAENESRATCTCFPFEDRWIRIGPEHIVHNSTEWVANRFWMVAEVLKR